MTGTSLFALSFSKLTAALPFMKKRRLFILLWISCAFASRGFAQPADNTAPVSNTNDTSSVLISSVNVTGNKHTKIYIILREIQFKAGDRIRKNDLPAAFALATSQVFNTTLFTEVKIDSVAQADSSLAVNVAVKEKWYILPTPQFRLTDRSFNEWVKTYHASFNRVVYGARFAHYNFSGRRDQFRLTVLNGYARNASIAYSNPSVGKGLNYGYSAATGFTQNREIPIATSYYNKLLQYKRTGFIRNSFSAAGSITRRYGYFKSVSAGAAITYINIDDSILLSRYGPNYFNDSKHYQVIPDFSIGMSYSKTDNVNYPLKGLAYAASVTKRGFQFNGGINATIFQAAAAKYFTHPHHFYSTIQAAGVLKLPFEQAYINRSAIGYGNLTLRGLEVYVVDGVAAGVLKYTLAKQVASFQLPIPFHIRIKSVSKIPFTLYAKTYADAGYSYIPKQYDTRLNNRLLYTGGFGLDILTLYGIVFKLEYSFNQLGENGLFLHGKGGF